MSTHLDLLAPEIGVSPHHMPGTGNLTLNQTGCGTIGWTGRIGRILVGDWWGKLFSIWAAPASLGGETGAVAKEARTGDGGEGGRLPLARPASQAPFHQEKSLCLVLL